MSTAVETEAVTPQPPSRRPPPVPEERRLWGASVIDVARGVAFGVWGVLLLVAIGNHNIGWADLHAELGQARLWLPLLLWGAVLSAAVARRLGRGSVAWAAAAIALVAGATLPAIRARDRWSLLVWLVAFVAVVVWQPPVRDRMVGRLSLANWARIAVAAVCGAVLVVLFVTHQASWFGPGRALGLLIPWSAVLFWLFLGVAIACTGTRWRAYGVASYALAFAAAGAMRGVPVQDRNALILWLIGLLAVATLGRPGRSLGRLLAEWLPFGLVLIAYDYSRAAAQHLGMPLQIEAQLNVDRFLFFGHVPTVWLQQHLLTHDPLSPRDPGHIAWWETLVTLVYLSHFLASYVLAAWLWFKDHAAWAKYTARFVTLSFLGVATYALLPAAPPWWASWEADKFHGYQVRRSVGDGFQFFHLKFASGILHNGQRISNVTAALPSLHCAFATLVSVTLWPRVRNRFVRVLLVLYPIWMGFALVLSGEHYVADILMGMLYVGIVVLVWNRIDSWWARTRGERAAPTPGVAAGQAAPAGR